MVAFNGPENLMVQRHLACYGRVPAWILPENLCARPEPFLGLPAEYVGDRGLILCSNPISEVEKKREFPIRRDEQPLCLMLNQNVVLEKLRSDNNTVAFSQHSPAEWKEAHNWASAGLYSMNGCRVRTPGEVATAILLDARGELHAVVPRGHRQLPAIDYCIATNSSLTLPGVDTTLLEAIRLELAHPYLREAHMHQESDLLPVEPPRCRFSALGGAPTVFVDQVTIQHIVETPRSQAPVTADANRMPGKQRKKDTCNKDWRGAAAMVGASRKQHAFHAVRVGLQSLGMQPYGARQSDDTDRVFQLWCRDDIFEHGPASERHAASVQWQESLRVVRHHIVTLTMFLNKIPMCCYPANNDRIQLIGIMRMFYAYYDECQESRTMLRLGVQYCTPMFRRLREWIGVWEGAETVRPPPWILPPCGTDEDDLGWCIVCPSDRAYITSRSQDVRQHKRAHGAPGLDTDHFNMHQEAPVLSTRGLPLTEKPGLGRGDSTVDPSGPSSCLQAVEAASDDQLQVHATSVVLNVAMLGWLYLSNLENREEFCPSGRMLLYTLAACAGHDELDADPRPSHLKTDSDLMPSVGCKPEPEIVRAPTEFESAPSWVYAFRTGFASLLLGAVAPIAGQICCFAGLAASVGATSLATAAHASSAATAVRAGANVVGEHITAQHANAVEDAEAPNLWVITDHDRDTHELIRRGLAVREIDQIRLDEADDIARATAESLEMQEGAFVHEAPFSVPRGSGAASGSDQWV